MNPTSKSRYYFDLQDLQRDPEFHARNLRSLLIMAEYSAMQMIEGREYYGDRKRDMLNSLSKILNLLTNEAE